MSNRIREIERERERNGGKWNLIELYGGQIINIHEKMGCVFQADKSNFNPHLKRIHDAIKSVFGLSTAQRRANIKAP